MFKTNFKIKNELLNIFKGNLRSFKIIGFDSYEKGELYVYGEIYQIELYNQSGRAEKVEKEFSGNIELKEIKISDGKYLEVLKLTGNIEDFQ